MTLAYEAGRAREGAARVDHPNLRDADWRISSFSGTGSSCVEVAANLPGIVAVRDSKDRRGPALVFAPSQWRALVGTIRHGRLSL
jgi:hypothetical protein